MTEKENLFCGLFSQTLDAKSAAAKAGFENPELAGINLLKRNQIKHKILKMISEQSEKSAVKGIEKIAFGSIADAVKLLLSENEDDRESIEKYDLFNVSEIKKNSNGSVEIKFFDRLKALEMLCTYEEAEKGNTNDFFDAINRSASVIGSENDEV